MRDTVSGPYSTKTLRLLGLLLLLMLLLLLVPLLLLVVPPLLLPVLSPRTKVASTALPQPTRGLNTSYEYCKSAASCDRSTKPWLLRSHALNTHLDIE